MTLQEVLLKSGWSQAQIDALDAKAMSGLTEHLSSIEKTASDKEKAAADAAIKAEADRKAAEASAAAAKTAQEAAELQKRSVDEFWANTYSPSIEGWEKKLKAAETKAANDAALAAFYKAQNEGARAGGFIPVDAPAFTVVPPVVPAVDPNKTPGTPTLVDPNALVARAGDAFKVVNDIAWKYQTLYNGQPLPVAPSELIAQADALKLSPMEYAARTFKFAEKEQAAREAAAKAHDDQIAATAIAAKEEAHKAELKKLQDEFNAKEKLRAEQHGNNPDVKQAPGSAKFAELQRATKSGERPDPTKMSSVERRNLTLTNIHKALEERQAAVA